MSIATPRPAHLPGIQALRGLAAMMVVLTHIYSMELKYSPDQLLGAWSYYGGLGVDLFFVISGFIMVHVTRDLQTGADASGLFLLRRVLRIYPLYWVVSFAVLAVYLYRPEMVFSGIDSAPDLVKSFTLWPDSRPPLLAIGWTLTFEMMFYLVFALSLLLPRRFLPIFLGLWAAVIITAQIPLRAGMFPPSPALGLLFSPMSLEFILGAALGLYLLKADMTAAQSIRLIVIGALAGIFAAGILSLNDEWVLDNFAVRAAVFAGPAALIVFGIAARDRAGRPVSKALQTLGDWSYAIYLTHILTLAVIGALWKNFASPAIWDNLLMLPIFLTGSIAIGGAAYILIERPLIGALKAALPKRA